MQNQISQEQQYDYCSTIYVEYKNANFDEDLTVLYEDYHAIIENLNVDVRAEEIDEAIDKLKQLKQGMIK